MPKAVYKACCWDCQDFNIGKTKRRKTEHWGSTGGASHQCDRGSNPGPGVISGLILLLVLVLALRVFVRVSPVFLPPRKSTFLHSNSIGNSSATALSVVRLLCVTLVKQSKFSLYIFNILHVK